MMVSFRLEPHEVVQIVEGRRIARLQTRHQLVEVIDLPGLGETIFIDGAPQISAADAPVFNELIVHAPLCAVDDPTTVFVAGVASGGAIAETLKHPSVDTIYGVDIDREAMEFFGQHVSFLNSAALSDSRVKLIFADARTYLSDFIPDSTLDVIIVDLPDPSDTSPSKKLFTKQFYALARRKLKSGGVLLTQAGRYRLGAMTYHSKVRTTCREEFVQIKTYHFYYPCYYEPWSFLLCGNSKVRFPDNEKIDRILKKRNVKNLQFYCGTTDSATSQIPPLLERAVDRSPQPPLID
jgi:spermidine synthase